MAEQSPQNVLNNDKSVDGSSSSSTDAHAAHLSQPTAAQGSPVHTAAQHQPQPDSDLSLPDSKPASDSPHLNGSIDRELDNATPDQHGSDTDSSRPDASKQTRSASLKKPVSFKPVSITKSFLAKTATTPGNTPPPVKPAEKGAPSHLRLQTPTDPVEASPQMATLQPNTKPRLIAKTGSSGLRDIPRTQSGDGTSTPNGRTVWNKNQRECYIQLRFVAC